MDGNSNDVSTEGGQQQQQQPQTGGEQAHPGASGEGAASALAQLKTQTRQHRRQSGDSEDPSGGSVQ